MTPSVTLGRAEAGAGHVVDAKYRFTVAADAPSLPPDQTVFVHLLDESGDLLWADDHRPPVPSEQWKPGAVIEYARPVTIPRGVADDRLSLEVGLYDRSGARLPLKGQDSGGRSYRVATLTALPPGEEPSAAFAEGWYDLEIPDNTGALEWHWSSSRGAIRMRNPRTAAVLVLDIDQPMAPLPRAQQVEIRTGESVLDAFTMAPGQRELRRIPLSAQTLGSADIVSFVVAVDPTFVPARVQHGSADPRELGVRVFHAYLAAP